MEIKDIEKLLSDNSEAVAFVQSLNTQAQNAEELKNTINKLESQKQEVIDSRKNQDAKYSEMLKLLGTEELTVEAVEDFNKRLNSKGDESIKAEVANLKGMIDKLNDEKANISKEYESKLDSMTLTNEIRDLGIGTLASTSVAEQTILSFLKEGATREDGRIVYKNQDGTTMYDANNTLMTPTAKLESMKSNPDYAPFFKPDAKGGSGTPPSGQGDTRQGAKKRSEMSNAEKGSFIKEHGQEAYLKLQN